MRRLLPALLAALLLAALGACARAPAEVAPVEVAPAAPDQGTVIDPPVQLSDFTLPSSRDGQPVSLSDLRGGPTLLFFGYTFCPDVCPTTLSDIKRAKDLLGADGEALNVIFISVDPERDTPEVLARYVGAFDPSFIGLQGDEATFRQIGEEYGLYYQRRQVEGSATYLMDHSAATYLLDGEGRLRTVFGFGTPAATLQAAVAHLLAE
jgi:protein SCO1/2